MSSDVAPHLQVFEAAKWLPLFRGNFRATYYAAEAIQTFPFDPNYIVI